MSKKEKRKTQQVKKQQNGKQTKYKNQQNE